MQLPMSLAIPAVLFLPPAGESASEKWMSRARLAACCDTIESLRLTHQVSRILVLAAEDDDRSALGAAGAEVLAPPADQGPFHFGNSLAAVAASLGKGAIAYFGGASAPLASSRLLSDVLADAGHPGRAPTAWVNNTLSTDWAVLSSSEGLVAVSARLTTDNPLGWILQHEAGYQVLALPASAETQADIDTPADVLLLAGHPRVGNALKAFIADVAEPELMAKVDALRRVMSTPASTLAIIGRSSSAIWREIERRRQIWVRLFVEERGMLASGRAERGEVRSLIGELLDDWGPERFVNRLAAMADGLLWDNRVWMAHRGLWPSAADRFASDLGWAEELDDPVLAALTRALHEARIPILTGGHSLVSGSLLALLESLPPPDAG
jgi:CTP:molybdopterin cytidylyltransferase MocA